MKLFSWALTDVGQKRDHNEDGHLADQDHRLFVVADGMGGHAGGAQASSIAVKEIHTSVIEADLDTAGVGNREGPACRALRYGARRASHEIFRISQQQSELSGMGTTLTALLFHQHRVCLAHVGDSRAYLFRDGRIEQLSEDHSWINEQVKAGFLSQKEAKESKFKHIITRSVGFEKDVNVDVLSMPVLMGDCYLLCSDGLSNYLENEELSQILATHYYSHIPHLLVDLANERGGDDNITVVLVYVANDR
jgi:protein phosphatase